MKKEESRKMQYEKPGAKLKDAAQKALWSQLRINKFMEMVSEKEFNPAQKLKLRDLISEPSLGTVAILLENCVNSKVIFERAEQIFCWYDTSQYASNHILFAVDYDTQIHYDARGRILDPFFFYKEATSFINQYYKLGLGEGPCTLTPINLTGESNDDMCTIKPASAAEASAYLLRKEWGGSKRCPRTDMSKRAFDPSSKAVNVLFHASGISKKGKNGMDYYIVPKYNNQEFQSFNKLVADQESEKLNKVIYPAQHVFAKKLEKIAEIKAMRDQTSQQNTLDVKVELLKLSERCKANPVAKLPLVQIPQLDLELSVSTLTLDDLLDGTLETIEQEKQKGWVQASAENALDRLEKIVEKWEKFAPLYAAQRSTIEMLDGGMIIYGDHAWIELPSTEQIGILDTIEAPFGSTQFALVLDELERRKQKHAEAEERIRQL